MKTRVKDVECGKMDYSNELKTIDLARKIHYTSNRNIKVKDAEEVIKMLTQVMSEELANGKTIKLGSFMKLRFKPQKSRVLHNVTNRERRFVTPDPALKASKLVGAERAAKKYVENFQSDANKD